MARRATGPVTGRACWRSRSPSWHCASSSPPLALGVDPAWRDLLLDYEDATEPVSVSPAASVQQLAGDVFGGDFGPVIAEIREAETHVPPPPRPAEGSLPTSRISEPPLRLLRRVPGRG